MTKKTVKTIRPRQLKAGEKLKEGKPASRRVVVGIAAQVFDQGKLARAFNTWQQRYVQDPEKFQRDFESAAQFASERAKGETPTYGGACADYLLALLRETD